MTLKLLIGTRNPSKVAELRALLRGLDLELESVADLADPPPDPPEDAPSYAENAVFKALAYARATGLPTIADDSGLEVDALGGAPGVRSRRYFGEDVSSEDRNRMLLGLLDGVTERTARFVAVVALARPDGRVETFDGEVRGEIAESPRGDDGFGYDPIFIIAEDGRTMAEVPRDQKNAISHRGLAAAKLRAALADA
ncbi:MAG TPA: non-canonical purine NTP pyrophosphatase, RdgB/HAM1 family [Chloroflexi bacterium]|nr:non-canonical purine NTP pyrophosphatase, RdgB/HAM1 family [Chloroflexota bacterium]HAL26125.1 non-canonical purine NTP pyrophosphatase, RdgB/HAM1 family [Chloroflexota bacterium]